MPTHTVEISVSAILFDSDGTLVNSTPSISSVLQSWCQLQGVDPRVLVSDTTIHGVRTKEILRKYQRLPKLGSELSEEELDLEAVKSEELVIEAAAKAKERGDTNGITPLSGVISLLEKLRSMNFEKWGIVTSATSKYADSALSLAGIENAPFIVSGDDTAQGKPSPEPYLAGLKELENRKMIPSSQLDPSSVLVIEDSPAGITSALEAGCQVVAVCTGAVKETQIVEFATRSMGSIFVIRDLTSVEIVGFKGDKLKMKIEVLNLSPQEDSSVRN
ncbi:hypothetical protein JCM5350_002676 [Sporobolomyces pararoseus]